MGGFGRQGYPAHAGRRGLRKHRRAIHRRKQAIFRVREKDRERLRAAVAGMQAMGLRCTLDGAVGLGLVLAARQLERRWNRGRRFPAVSVHSLKVGRRPSKPPPPPAASHARGDE